MKYHNWTKYGQYGMIVEITIRDDSNAKIATFRVNSNDKKAIRKVLRTIKQAYGIDLSEKVDKDLSWLK